MRADCETKFMTDQSKMRLIDCQSDLRLTAIADETNKAPKRFRICAGRKLSLRVAPCEGPAQPISPCPRDRPGSTQEPVRRLLGDYGYQPKGADRGLTGRELSADNFLNAIGKSHMSNRILVAEDIELSSAGSSVVASSASPEPRSSASTKNPSIRHGLAIARFREVIKATGSRFAEMTEEEEQGIIRVVRTATWPRSQLLEGAST